MVLVLQIKVILNIGAAQATEGEVVQAAQMAEPVAVDLLVPWVD